MFVNLFRISMCQAPQSPDSYVDSLLSMENTGNAIPGVTPHLRKKNYFTRAHVNTLRKKNIFTRSLASFFFTRKSDEQLISLVWPIIYIFVKMQFSASESQKDILIKKTYTFPELSFLIL